MVGRRKGLNTSRRDKLNFMHRIRFDIQDFSFETEDEPGMLRTVRSLNELITAEVDAGIPAERIVLGGFSQGAAMTLVTGLTSERKLAGLIVMSGWLPLRNKFKAVSVLIARGHNISKHKCRC